MSYCQLNPLPDIASLCPPYECMTTSAATAAATLFISSSFSLSLLFPPFSVRDANVRYVALPIALERQRRGDFLRQLLSSNGGVRIRILQLFLLIYVSCRNTKAIQ